MASTLSSASSDAEIWAAYDDNASYLEDDSAAKAAAFVTACTMILRRHPKRMAHGGRGAEEIETAPEVLQGELRDARAFLLGKRTATSGRCRFMSFEHLR